MKVYQIIEARKNPTLNPKTSINKVVYYAIKNADSTVANTKNAFVSFTAIDKLGVNPMSKYDTPIGIYAYPAEYVFKTVGSKKPMAVLPFAGEQPYVNIFAARGNIVNLTTIGAAETNALYKKIATVYVTEMRRTSIRNKQELADQVMQHIRDAGKKAKFPEYSGGQLWYVTRATATELADAWNTKPAIAWNKLFRMIGVNGCVDYSPDGGAGIIHTSEPTQAVFFDIGTVADIKRYDNKYSASVVSARKIEGRRKHAALKDVKEFLKQPHSPSEIAQFFEANNYYKYIQLVSDQAARSLMLKVRPTAIVHLPDPTAEDQQTAITENPTVINAIERPIESTVLAGLENHPAADFQAGTLARKLPSASEKLQLRLISMAPTAAYYFTKSYRSVINQLIPSFKEAEYGYPKWFKTLAKQSGVQFDLSDSAYVRNLTQQVNSNKNRIQELEADTAQMTVYSKKVFADYPAEKAQAVANKLQTSIADNAALIKQLQIKTADLTQKIKSEVSF